MHKTILKYVLKKLLNLADFYENRFNAILHLSIEFN